MASSDDEEDLVVVVTTSTTTLVAVYYQYFVEKTICHDSILSGEDHVDEVLNGHDARCQDSFRMEKHVFLRLCDMLKEKELLRHNNGVRVEEKVAIFMLVVGHNERNRILQERFQHSGETISRHFNAVLDSIVALADDFLVPAGPDTPTEILENPRFYPYFKDCIGSIDGTQIPAMVGLDEQVPFWCRKGFISQNVLVACSFDLQFQYVLAGWEGSAADSRILDSSLTRCHRLIVPEVVFRDPLNLICESISLILMGGSQKRANKSWVALSSVVFQMHCIAIAAIPIPTVAGKIVQCKFYLADAGFANMPQFITPYRGVRYHLKEFGGNRPKCAKELFNLRHASLRNAIERAIGILKRRFTILQLQPQYPFESQVKIVLACCILHNHIRRECINDLIFDDENLQNLLETDPRMQQDSECPTLGRNRQREVASELRTSIADAMWNDYQCRRRG
ncbi:uncharacterized protein LOC113329688 [Papaver somniferum]|uniref:uncharacterized protein LOC113329688 n=1 Tax=Papaver somniferum TaxID=3469 RepID=UPI000E6FFF3C|nr:uncharacterized protein LOC113329688 [Papaver somniferum]